MRSAVMKYQLPAMFMDQLVSSCALSTEASVIPKRRASSCPGDIGRESTGDSGEGRGNSGERVSPGRGKDDGGEGNHDHVTGIGGVVGNHRNQCDHWSEDLFWDTPHRRFNSAGKEPRAFGHAGSEHDDQNVSERMEVGEGLGHFHPDLLDVLWGKEAFGFEDQRSGSVFRHLGRMGG